MRKAAGSASIVSCVESLDRDVQAKTRNGVLSQWMLAREILGDFVSLFLQLQRSRASPCVESGPSSSHRLVGVQALHTSSSEGRPHVRNEEMMSTPGL